MKLWDNKLLQRHGYYHRQSRSDHFGYRRSDLSVVECEAGIKEEAGS